MGLSVRQIHYVVSILLILGAVYFQSYVLGMSQWSVFHVDLVTIIVVYIAVEHPMVDAIVRLLIAALAMSTLSAAPGGFFVMYYMQVLVLASFIARRVVLWGRVSQVALFGALLILKYLLFAVFVVSQGGLLRIGSFVLSALPSLVSTGLVALPVFRVLAALDVFFEVQRGREGSGYSPS